MISNETDIKEGASEAGSGRPSAETGKPGRLPFRSDIEGLRAVAILLVVGAHAQIPWLQGGFVGVDVFFVLSGFLITGLLVREFETNGRIAFAAFYARRFRRLMPGLLLMLVATSILAYLLVAPAEQPEQAKSAASAAAWVSNFYFALSNQGYFSPGSEANLFLHTWSLGVEEQFYLVWPCLLLVGLGRQAISKQTSYRLNITLGLTLLVSVVACAWWMETNPNLGFYMMPSRAWQFTLGAFIWLHFGSANIVSESGRAQRRPMQLASQLARHPLTGWLGMSLIVAAALLLDDNVAYPSLWALVPTIGTALVLTSGGCNPNAGIGKLLSLRPIQVIGNASYSWYLWHWPILLLGAAVYGNESTVNRAFLVLLSLALAMISQRFVETPIRHNDRLIRQPHTAVFAAVVLVVLTSACALRWFSAAFDRLREPEQVRYAQAKSDAPEIYRAGCDEWYTNANVRPCTLGLESAPRKAVAMGDSIGLQWYPALVKLFPQPEWEFTVLTKSACPMVDEEHFYSRIGRIYSECTQWRNDALVYLANKRPQVVVLGSSFVYDFTQEQWQAGTARFLKRISSSADEIIILRSTPKLPFDGPSCAAPRSILYSMLVGAKSCTSSAGSQLESAVLDSLNAAASEFDNVRVVDMTDAVCPDGICRAEYGGKIVFRDSQHLSAEFAESLAEELGSQLNTGK